MTEPPTTIAEPGDPRTMELVSQLKEESRLTMKLSPSPGEMLRAKTVGGTLNALAGLLEACGKPVGVTTDTLIEKIETEDDGTIAITVLALRLVPPSNGDAS